MSLAFRAGIYYCHRCAFCCSYLKKTQHPSSVLPDRNPLINLTSNTLTEGVSEFCSAPHFMPGPLGHSVYPGGFMTTVDGRGKLVALHTCRGAFLHYQISVKCLRLTSMGHSSHEAAAVIPSGSLGWDPR